MDFLGTTQLMKSALSTMSDAAFQQAGSALSEGKEFIREKLQGETAGEIHKIIKKLAGEESLSTAEMNLVRLWIVGDAESYTMTEHDFPQWIEEYGRLEKTVADYARKKCTAEDLFKLHGILQDAVRVSYDIANYLEQKERVKKFESAVGEGLDKDEREALVKVLTGKLQSRQY